MNLLEFIPPKKFYLIIINFLLGLTLAFSFEPFSIPFLSVLIIGIYFSMNDYVFSKLKNYHRIFFYNGISFGFGFFLLSMYWVSNSVTELDPALSYIAPLITICLPFSLSIFFGLMQIVNAYCWDNSNSKIFYFSAVWIICEFFRSILFTGLPWNLIGYSWSWSLAYSQTVSILGIYGLGLLTTFCAVCIFSFLSNSKNKNYLIIAIVILILLYIHGSFRINDNQTNYSEKNLRIVHTHFDQKDKWTKKAINETATMGSLDLITVFPETSLGYDTNWPENWIYGYIRKEKGNFFNSVRHMEFTYDKKILVPFGEYFPFSKAMSTLFPESIFFQSELTKGSDDQIFPFNISPLICYEIIFPSFVRESISNQTNLLVNISNDGWFGNFSGPKQHFVHAQFRSIELGIPLVRSSNKGFSGMISPIGEIMNLIDTGKNTYLDVKIPKKLETTIFREYGNLFTYFLIVLFFIIGYAISSKQKI